MKKRYKVDLHTHSIISHDGGITEQEYKRLLSKGIIDVVAITDHNEISFAQYMRKKYGNQIIVGEEIMTKEGEIIGLFLEEKISSGMSAKTTIARIKEQKGLVYIPHPFETFRKGLSEKTLEAIYAEVDILEVYNARSLQPNTRRIASELDIVGVVSSDAHGFAGVGTAYTLVSEIPTKRSMLSLVKDGTLVKRKAPLRTFLYPKMNKLKKMFSAKE